MLAWVMVAALRGGQFQLGGPIKAALAVQTGTSPLAPVHTDPVENAFVRGIFRAPAEGESLGTHAWKTVLTDKDGWFRGDAFEGGYASVTVDSPREQIVLLEAAGDSFAYVNGELRPGDVYQYGNLSLPIKLKSGINNLVFRCVRGQLKVLIQALSKPISLDARDSTLPDVTPHVKGDTWGALVLRNATEASLDSLVIETSPEGGATRRTKVGPLLPLSSRKVGFLLAGNAAKVKVRLLQGGKELDQLEVTRRVRKTDQPYMRTFVSGLDGSVQYFAVNPTFGKSSNPALVLSLHGASVEASGQAEAYSSKSWANIVAATNRRPYGFDWEDWGRRDALEVLGIAKKELPYDPSRVYLVGHSMGGHGTWQLGALYPDLFAAISPSAGWISTFTYAGAKHTDNPAPVQSILERAASTSDTPLMAHNYMSEGVFIIHGDADDNVPVTEARNMVKILGEFHHDFVLHEQPKQNHWWDISPEPGADCLDLAEMFDFLAHNSLPPEDSVRNIDFTTMNPGVSARCHWATIWQQTKEQEPSTVHLLANPFLRQFLGDTQNVRTLVLQGTALHAGKGIHVELDGQKLDEPSWTGSTPLVLTRESGKWQFGGDLSSDHKNPERYGPLRLGFDHRFEFVYGTHGTPEENAWAIAKARYDAETFWYRGNGSVDVVSDREFHPEKDKDRSIVLYGNAATNGSWKSLLSSSPVQVDEGFVSVGGRKLADDGLACVFIRPRPGSKVASVVAISGSGIVGMKTTNLLPYLQPMVGFPDFLVTGPDVLKEGSSAVEAAGFFDIDWSLTSQDVAYRGDPSPKAR